MKILIVGFYICETLRTRLAALVPADCSLTFANEAPEVITDTLALANESAALKPTDGWVMLAPYGRFDNAQGMQEFLREDADAIVNEFKSLANLPQRLLGLPWYIGHPDHPRFTDKYKDTRAYGRIKELDARADGLFANVKWSAAGKQLLEDEAFHGHSVNWKVRKSGSVHRPFSLKSVGFTNEPQIPVAPAMANETQTTTTMPKWLIDMLVAAGLMKAEGTEENAKSALQGLIDNAGKLPAAEKAKTEAETALANEKALRTTAEKAKADADTAFANERKARAGDLLSAAEKDGRILPADRAKWEGEFANEFTGTATKLAAAKSEMKTTRTTPDYLAKRTAPSKSKIEQVQEFVNERMNSTKETYDVAFSWVQTNKPELFSSMKQPGQSTQ